jgi:hypothetical protein
MFTLVLPAEWTNARSRAYRGASQRARCGATNRSFGETAWRRRRSGSRGIELRTDRDAGQTDERLQDLSDRDGLSGADIEGAALIELQRGRVRPRHIADVEEVALGVEATMPNDRLGDARLGFGDLLRERRRSEPGMLPRAVLVGRPEDHDRRAVTGRELARQRFGRDLRGRIHVARPERRVFVHRNAVGRAVHVGA